ncbi:UbiA family prenyltransferase [Halegenticoccus soli]|uniref:UbiA family prenyltransferase n=1 Tax=Halegenticoccus soli TaxID=1985678 RepID=UPI0018EE16EE|nr:UbiA family prenyltransferase [Halegenticoccus soli]
MSWFGALLADDLSIATGVGHSLAICLAVYVAHLKDGYIDFYTRGEDTSNPLTPAEIHVAITVSAATFMGCVGFLWITSGIVAAVLTIPVVVLALLHAPYLDTTPVTTTIDYPLGIAFTTMGGYAAQTNSMASSVIAVSLIFFLQLAAIGVLLDLLDYPHDHLIAKRTLPVVLGRDRAKLVTWTLVAAAVCLLVLSSALGVFPHCAATAASLPLGAMMVCLNRGYAAGRAVSLFIKTTYAFGGVLFLTVRPGLLC